MASNLLIMLKKLYSLWLNERVNPSLGKLDIDTLQKAQEYLRKEKKNELQKIIGRLIEFLLNDIAKMRMSKIISCVLSGELIGNPFPWEIELFKRIKESLTFPTIQPAKEDFLSSLILNVKIPKETIKRKLVRITRDLPPFLGVDGIIYRGLKRKTIANIPEENAKYIRDKEEIVI